MMVVIQSQVKEGRMSQDEVIDANIVAGTTGMVEIIDIEGTRRHLGPEDLLSSQSLPRSMMVLWM